MKRYDILFLAFIIPVLLILPGCLDEQVRTIVSADGSVERIYSFQNNTRTIPTNAFPRPSDDSWRVEWKKPKATDSTIVYTASKKFPSAEELNKEYADARDTGNVGIDVSINKQFGWFYTYLDYSEKYTMRNPLQRVPVTDFMTKDEIDRYVRGETSDTLNHKVDMWDLRNLYEAFYSDLIAEAERRNDRELAPALLKEKKEELFTKVIAADSLDRANKKKEKDSTKNKFDDMKNVMKFCAGIYGTNAILKYDSFAQAALEKIYNKQHPGGHPENWLPSVQMPGILLATNSSTVEGNSASWKFNSKQIHVGDYAMTASSRVANIWAFVVTGIGALMVVALGFIGMVRRKR
ncbi:MAG: hypothetical protein ACHQQQ_03430 [Bacteroidota bacterium]